MVLGLELGGVMGMLVNLFFTFVPWLVALVFFTAALYMYVKIKKSGMWAFVKTSPGDDILFTKNKDGSGDLRKGQYYKQDSTIQDAGDDYDPFVCPSAEAGINLAGRRIFQVFRGLGSVQSMEGMAAATILKNLGVKNGKDFKDFMKEGKYMIVPDAAVNEFEDVIEERDDGEERKVTKVELEYQDQNGNISTKTVSGLAVDLSKASNVAPYNVKSEQLGSVRARARNLAQKKLEQKNWAKWIGIGMVGTAFMVLMVIIVMQVLGGGGSGTESVGMVI